MGVPPFVLIKKPAANIFGTFCLVNWLLFPERALDYRRDVMVLSPLPVRGWTMFLAKVAAVGTVALAATSTAWVMHGHSTARTAGDASSAPRSAVVASPVMMGTGAHAGAPSDKIVSTHKAVHAKPSGPTLARACT